MYAHSGYSVHTVEANGHCGPNSLLHQINVRKLTQHNGTVSLQSAGDVRKVIAAELLGSRKDSYWDLTSDLWGRRSMSGKWLRGQRVATGSQKS